VKHAQEPLMILSALAWFPSHALARPSVTEYTNKANWQAAVNSNFTTVDLTGFPQGTFVTSQYSDLGVTFTDGNDSIYHTASFIDDGVGLEGNNIIHLSFSVPMNWIAIDFPGMANIKLLNQGNLIYTSNDFGSQLLGNFAGLVSTAPFDGAIPYKSSGDDVSIDNLFFGPPIPVPGSLALLGIAALMPTRRKRRCA